MLLVRFYLTAYRNGVIMLDVMQKQPRRAQMNWAPTPDDFTILDRLSKKLNISDSALIRLGLRLLYEREFPQSHSNAAD